MNSLTNNDNNYFIARDLGHKEVVVSNKKYSSEKSTSQHIIQDDHVMGNDVSTASYVRGYN